jgi:ribosomal protein S18 acetylase RimI-like enzyme
MAVCDGDRAGLFCIAVDPARRRRGLGATIVRALCGWAHARGAREAYLEVERRNAPAVALYRSLGFTVAYDYVHRVAP